MHARIRIPYSCLYSKTPSEYPTCVLHTLPTSVYTTQVFISIGNLATVSYLIHRINETVPLEEQEVGAVGILKRVIDCRNIPLIKYVLGVFLTGQAPLIKQLPRALQYHLTLCHDAETRKFFGLEKITKLRVRWRGCNVYPNNTTSWPLLWRTNLRLN